MMARQPAIQSLIEWAKAYVEERRRIDKLKGKDKKVVHRGYVAVEDESTSGNVLHIAQQQTPKCDLCDENHFLKECNKFLNFDAQTRREYLKSARRCYKCFRTGHVIGECRSKIKCKECNSGHHTLLHGSKPYHKTPDRVNFANDDLNASQDSRDGEEDNFVGCCKRR